MLLLSVFFSIRGRGFGRDWERERKERKERRGEERELFELCFSKST